MQFIKYFSDDGPKGKGGSTGTLIMMGLMILVFWMFMIRPQAKKAKQQKAIHQQFAES